MAREPIQQTVERLAHTSGGRILASARDGLRRSLKYYVALFLVGRREVPWVMCQWCLAQRRSSEAYRCC